MLRNAIIVGVCFIVIGVWLPARMSAQDKLVYVLTRAELTAGQGIEVLFGKSFPSDEAAGSTQNWQVIAIDVSGNTRSFSPQSVEVDALNKEVILRMGAILTPGGPLDVTTNRIIINYTQANLPTVRLGELEKKGARKAFVAAKGKKDADIYFNGSATGQKGSGPIYSIEARAGYLQSLNKAGSIGGQATFMSDAASDVDPDSITASGTYQKIFVLHSTWGIILNSDFLGGEFDKKNKTLNLMTEADGTLVLPSKRFGERNFATMDFMAGFEGGHNYKHELNPKGLGNIWRPKFGVNAYFVALAPKFFNRVNLSANYILRLPQTAEPFTQKVNGEKVTSLTTRPRHHVDLDLGLMFAPSYGLSIGYRYGSLPPDFKFVDHKITVGFTLQLKQANK